MTRRLALLALLAVAAVSLAAVAFSHAAYTTSSQTAVTATTDGISDWLSLYSEPADPDGATGYAHGRLINGGIGPLAATGAGDTLAVDLGGFPDRNTTFPFTCVFSLRTPATFPDASVARITVSVTLVGDAYDQPLSNPGLAPFGSGGGATTVTLGPGQVYQFNVSVRARRKFTLGRTYHPHVLVDVTGIGSVPAGYYRYDVPFAMTDIGGS